MSKGGDTEINWRILDPNGNVLITQDRISAADYEFNVQEGGEYMICLDNSFSKEYKIVTLAVENEISDEMTNFLEKISRVQETANAPPGLVVSRFIMMVYHLLSYGTVFGNLLFPLLSNVTRNRAIQLLQNYYYCNYFCYY